MKKFVFAGAIAALAPALACVCLASVLGTVVTAKSGEHALVIWDTTPLLETMVAQKPGQAAAMKTLESQAMQVAGERAAELTGSKTVTVRVVYQKIGAINPAYGTPTFAGVERVFDLTVDAHTAKTQSDDLAKSLGEGTVPAGVTVQITGKLPPL